MSILLLVQPQELKRVEGEISFTLTVGEPGGAWLEAASQPEAPAAERSWAL